jgi:hypothetical protein
MEIYGTPYEDEASRVIKNSSAVAPASSAANHTPGMTIELGKVASPPSSADGQSRNDNARY